MIKILPYLRLAVEHRASDLFFSADAPVMMKIEGEFAAIGKTRMTGEGLRELVESILTPEQQAVLEGDLELDFATQAGGLGRFRVNVFTQRNSLGMVLRRVEGQIPAVDALGLPPVLKTLALAKRGMILLVGATGSGKSTTLAAMIGHRNANMAGHILTIEDPIEFVHPNQRSIVNQREVGTDTESYERALKSAMREAPDVILIGEIRTRETMDATLQLANTGHLALSTLHANNAYQALQRIVNLYPSENRDQLYMDLAMTLRAIVSQRLVRGADGKRVVAVEVLVNTPFIQELILNRRISEIREAMAQSSDSGMQSFDDALFELQHSGRISVEEALANADSSANLQARISFGG
ncbi:PilT/PilU family type 4a pilus ATPase [Polycyclovorans algicola]|uniref:PilT/PilU family type 4a pilus ATPase n=1 Tax=Polycyclovorans algicola TaxID=616992 RepID=UPI0004A6F512|nr:PilT/PilU family type 4a pilus ATPase [Polycyclovorans algicola]